ncbi:hypothetical protein LX83_002684 [Goodfellowiella coeruleoviolacea]|uniref:Uncharacterized protein n=1 Tax=Goodfellowiella coeruleoviolacea TaxID=334858 RepID=A0AAE3GCR1_9PSEU|nr:hypothetical protein [Goodfellowiella coeruleoviolacea]
MRAARFTPGLQAGAGTSWRESARNGDKRVGPGMGEEKTWRQTVRSNRHYGTTRWR